MRRFDKLRVVLDVDPEIKRTFFAKTRLQRQQEVDREQLPPTSAANDKNKLLKDYATPSARELRSSIRRLLIDANNFELKPSLLSMMQQNQFGGILIDDPNLHLEAFLEFYETLKFNGASIDVGCNCSLSL